MKNEEATDKKTPVLELGKKILAKEDFQAVQTDLRRNEDTKPDFSRSLTSRCDKWDWPKWSRIIQVKTLRYRLEEENMRWIEDRVEAFQPCHRDSPGSY